MAKTLKFCWVFLFLLTTSSSSQLHEFYYDGFSKTSVPAPGISLDGVAEVQHDGILRLTNTVVRGMGHAFYPTALQFKNTSDSTAFSFSTNFAFSIIQEDSKHGGHGLAFTITASKELLKTAHFSEYLGLLNDTNNSDPSNHIFAIEFDTVKSSQFHDINDNHIGIDINSLKSNVSVPACYGGSELNMKSGTVIQVWIDYDGAEKLVNVTIWPFSSLRPSEPILSAPLDLSPILQKSMYVGFSASAAAYSSSHYIFGWSFKMNGRAQSLNFSTIASFNQARKESTASSHSRKIRTGTIAGVLVSATMVVVISALGIIYLYRKMKNADTKEPWELEYGLHRFSYKELRIATNGFQDKELLGVGGFGRVYKGILPNSETQIAVKQVSKGSQQGLREFVAEITTIGRLRHQNLVQLQGWYRRRGDLMLVYGFMCNGSLDKFLYDEPKSILSWKQRFNILQGIANALLYLHEEWEQIVVHCDVKASNVLLDRELNGRLGDFGLARSYDHGSNPNTTMVFAGTFGYLAPEIALTGKAMTSSDVFAYGALLLEVACGRRPIEEKAGPEEIMLVDWVWERWSAGKVLDVVDKRMAGDFEVEEVEMVLKLGLLCQHPLASKRPSTREVVRHLHGEGGPLEVAKSPPLDFRFDPKGSCG